MTSSEAEWRGYWWLPGKPEETVPGTLMQISEDGGVILKLIGGFTVDVYPPIDKDSGTISVNGNFPMILGSCAGERFTLLSCLALHTSGGFVGRNINEQDISVQRTLRGIHLKSPDERLFTSATIQVEYLLGWSQQTTIQAEVELDGWHWNGKQSASTSPVDRMTADAGTYRYSLELVFNQFQVQDRPASNDRSLANREWAELTIESPEPASFTGFDDAAKAVMDLMTLAAHTPAGVIEETLWFKPSDDHPTHTDQDKLPVQVMGRRIHPTKRHSDFSKPIDYLFTLADVAFVDVMPRWLDIHHRAWLACSMIAGLRYISAGYTSSRLLTAATAAESLHRSLRPEATLMPAAKFDALRSRVMEALKGHDLDSKAARTFVNGRLFNELTFKERLIALAEIPDAEAVAALIPNVDAWARFVRDQRNGMAHGNRERLGAQDVRAVSDALEVTIGLLGLVLMQELGIPGEVQRRAARLPYIEYVATQLGAALRRKEPDA